MKLDQKCIEVANIVHIGRTSVIKCARHETFVKILQFSTYKPNNIFQEVMRIIICQLYENKKLYTIQFIQDDIKDEIGVSDSLLKNALLRMGFAGDALQMNGGYRSY